MQLFLSEVHTHLEKNCNRVSGRFMTKDIDEVRARKEENYSTYWQGKQSDENSACVGYGVRTHVL